MSIVDVAPKLQQKSLATYGVVTVDEEEGIVEAYVSGIGNKDSVADIIMPGAFIESLKTRKPKGVWAHNWDRPVSKTLEAYEVPKGDPRLPVKMKNQGIGGLYVKTQFNLETQDGRDAFSWVKFYGDEGEWSIGYQVTDSEWDTKAKATRLKALELFEYSPVLFGANSLTSTVGVKSGYQNGDIKVKLEGVDEEMAEKIAKAIDEVVGNESEETVEETEIKADDAEIEVKAEEEGEIPEEIVPEVKDAEEEIATETNLEVKVEEDAEIPAEPTGELAQKSDDLEVDETPPVELKTSEIVEFTKQAMSNAKLTSYDAKVLRKFISSLVEEKTIEGSWEDIREEVQDALDEMYANFYVCIHSMFDSKVVYCFYDPYQSERTYWQASYSIVDDSAVLSDPQQIEVMEVIVAKNALIEAAYKGYGREVKALLRPLVDLSENEPLADDEYTKDLTSAIEAKAGATLSAANKKKISDSVDMIHKGTAMLGDMMGVVADAGKSEDEAEVKETDEEPEVKDLEANIEAETNGLVEIDLSDFEEFQALISPA